QAARAAARLGIEVRDTDLQKVWQLEREAMQPKQPQRGDETQRMGKTDRPDPRPGRPGKER
ncbi:hypothetical protein HF563_03915, partial [Acidithiobacillus ferridurans]|nr:hypothetical protein [Acidithiobacillus ferridurans]